MLCDDKCCKGQLRRGDRRMWMVELLTTGFREGLIEWRLKGGEVVSHVSILAKMSIPGNR